MLDITDEPVPEYSTAFGLAKRLTETYVALLGRSGAEIIDFARAFPVTGTPMLRAQLGRAFARRAISFRKGVNDAFDLAAQVLESNRRFVLDALDGIGMTLGIDPGRKGANKRRSRR